MGEWDRVQEGWRILETVELDGLPASLLCRAEVQTSTLHVLVNGRSATREETIRVLLMSDEWPKAATLDFGIVDLPALEQADRLTSLDNGLFLLDEPHVGQTIAQWSQTDPVSGDWVIVKVTHPNVWLTIVRLVTQDGHYVIIEKKLGVFYVNWDSNQTGEESHA